MAWFILFIAGIFETVWAVGLKHSEGFTRLWPSVLTVVAMAISLYLLAIALRSLPLGVAYPVWTGIGAVGAVIYGVMFFGESRDLLKIVFILMILGGIMGLRATTVKKSAVQKTEQSQAVGSKAKAGDDSARTA